MERQDLRLKQFVDEASEMRSILSELKNQLQDIRKAEKGTSERNHYDTAVSAVQHNFSSAADAQFNDHIDANEMPETYEHFEEDDFDENSYDASEEMANMDNQCDHSSNMNYVEVKREPNLDIAEYPWYNDVIDNNEPVDGYMTKIILNKSSGPSTNSQPLKEHQKTAQFLPYVKTKPRSAHDATVSHYASPAYSNTVKNRSSTYFKETIDYDDSEESVPVEID